MTDVDNAVITETPAEVTDANVDALFEQQKDQDAPVETKPEVVEEKKEEPKVPLGALHEERARRKALEAEKRQMTEELARFKHEREETTRMIQERIAAAQQPQVDPNERPVEYLALEQQKTQKMLEQMQQRALEQENRSVQEQQIQQFANVVRSDEAKFAVEKPDYMEAVGFAKEHKAKEYRAFGYSEDEVTRLVNTDAISIAQRALQIGESPARLAYEYALTMGFKPAVSGEKKLGMMEAGQKAAKPSSGGSKDAATLSLEQLASMTADDFSKVTDAQFKKLMGG